jgi:hypothetical protein
MGSTTGAARSISMDGAVTHNNLNPAWARRFETVRPSGTKPETGRLHGPRFFRTVVINFRSQYPRCRLMTVVTWG